MPLVATAVGAVLALGGAMMGDGLRSRNQRYRDHRTERRQSYLEFVTAADAATGRLRVIADPAEGVTEPAREADRAIGASLVYEAREKLLMSASPAVVRAAERLLDQLGALRQAVAGGAARETVPYHTAYHAYAGALWRLRQSIRADLGNAGLSPEDVGKRDWDTSETCSFCLSQAGARDGAT
jgi:hypothetical protein